MSKRLPGNDNKRRNQLCLLFSLLLLLGQAAALPAATQEEARAAVERRYRYTVPGFLGDFKAIGSVLSVQQEGLKADRPAALFKPNIIEAGRLTVTGGGSLPLGGKFDGRLRNNDRLYLYGCRTGEDFVELELFTVDSHVVSGSKSAIQLQASTRFRYAGGLAAVSTARLLGDIALWFRTGEEARPDPDESGTKVIQRGQTEEEVTAVFGAPEKKILLGAKSVFVYRKVKVIFVDGRVVDAE